MKEETIKKLGEIMLLYVTPIVLAIVVVIILGAALKYIMS